MSFGCGRGNPSSLSSMGVPGGAGARQCGYVGPLGQNAGKVGGSLPDRVDQLFFLLH